MRKRTCRIRVIINGDGSIAKTVERAQVVDAAKQEQQRRLEQELRICGLHRNQAPSLHAIKKVMPKASAESTKPAMDSFPPRPQKGRTT